MQEELGRLVPIELRKIWETEHQDFTPWLAKEENLDLLGETLNMELELEKEDMPVGDFKADIVCRNSENDTRVLIENQLEVTDHKHLGQILTYAAGLDVHTVIWIAKEFRDEHRAALDRLNEMRDERFRFFGIEIKVWQFGNSDSAPRAPQFEIVSKPNDWSRSVDQRAERAKSENLTDTQLLQKNFWENFSKYLVNKKSPIELKNPQPKARMTFATGKADFSFDAILHKSKKHIRIQLTMLKENATAHFNLLKDQSEEIEAKLGKLEWEENPGKKSSVIRLYKKETDLTNETDWGTHHEWLKEKLELFDEVFRPLIQELDADDWVPPEDEDDVFPADYLAKMQKGFKEVEK